MPTAKDIGLILKKLKKHFPNKGGMEVGSAYQTLVGVILSARTRDEQVLKLLPEFFSTFPSVTELAKASERQIAAKINTIGLYRAKAKNLKKMAQTVLSDFDGKIPETMDDLVRLGGVGRKTASVLLVSHFNKPAIAVDTHVHRVTNRLGWVKTSLPAKTEKALLKIIPKPMQPTVNRVFVKFGRYVCIPGKPRCWMCPVKDACPFKGKVLKEPKKAREIQDDIERRENLLEDLRKNAV